jgi:hypothetical protein
MVAEYSTTGQVSWARQAPLLTAEQERDARGDDAADHQPRKEDEY